MSDEPPSVAEPDLSPEGLDQLRAQREQQQLRPADRTGGRLGAVISLLTVVGIACLLLATIAGRSLRSPNLGLTVFVTFMPYLYALMVFWVFTLWCAVPDRREPPIALFVVLLAGLGLWGPSWPAWTGSDEGTPVRVVSWNLRRLWGGPDGTKPLSCAEQTLAPLAADVFSFQEVSRQDVDKLQQALSLTCVHTTYTGSNNEKHGGLASCQRKGSPWTLVKGQGQPFVDADNWSYVFSEFRHTQSDHQVFNLLTVHLTPYRAAQEVKAQWSSLSRWKKLLEHTNEVVNDQGRQSNALVERINRFHDPTIVAGDFNSTRDASLHVRLRKLLIDTWEGGAVGFGSTVKFGDWAPLRVDYIYTTLDFAPIASDVPVAGCSDHRPVVSDVVLKPRTSHHKAGG